MIDIPREVQEWLRGVFAGCNIQASRKLDRNPNAYEEHLDISIIENLQQHSAPVRFAGDWTVHVNTHFLGKVPMWRNFEVADIGILIMFRTASRFIRSKVGLLQSKRLFPLSVKAETEEQTEARYLRGFVGLFDSDNDFASLIAERVMTFTGSSKYKSMKGNSEQTKVIDEYEENAQIPVYYLFYNPSTLPHSVNMPASACPDFDECKVGARVVPARNVHAILGNSTGSPTFDQLQSGLTAPFFGAASAGWRLESFVVDLLLQCKVGRITDVRDDVGLKRIFYRRNGPIAAAISVTIDAPVGFDWEVLPDEE